MPLIAQKGRWEAAQAPPGADRAVGSLSEEDWGRAGRGSSGKADGKAVGTPCPAVGGTHHRLAPQLQQPGSHCRLFLALEICPDKAKMTATRVSLWEEEREQADYLYDEADGSEATPRG